ncbi:hypothetical protein TRVL_10221 [Trypanosoma vivax]|nr:hypothetical protein TRVL_10221 [Trypanosoma vivax]
MLAIHYSLGSAPPSELAAVGLCCSKRPQVLSSASTDMEHKKQKHSHVPHSPVPFRTVSHNANKAPTSTKISERSCGEHVARGARTGWTECVAPFGQKGERQRGS